MTGLDECYHRYCNFCWENYITTVVQDGGFIESIKCAAPKCLAELEDEVVLQLLHNNNIKKKYQRQITYSFVQVRKDINFFLLHIPDLESQCLIYRTIHYYVGVHLSSVIMQSKYK